MPKLSAKAQARDEQIARMLRALGHPVRVRVVRELVSNTASPVDYVKADRDAESLGAVSHHFKSLRTAGLVEIAETEQRRGAVKHVYRLTKEGRQVADWLGRL